MREEGILCGRKSWWRRPGGHSRPVVEKVVGKHPHIQKRARCGRSLRTEDLGGQGSRIGWETGEASEEMSAPESVLAGLQPGPSSVHREPLRV